MKKCMTAIISILLLSGIFVDNKVMAQTEQLDNVLVQYFDALRTGNLQILKSLLSDELLKRRYKTLSNPSYSEFLKNIYGQASFKIINMTQLTKDQVSVDIEVDSGSQTQINETIMFIKEHDVWKLHKDRKDLVYDKN